MLQKRRITIVTPEFSEPIQNQKIEVSSQIKSMNLFGTNFCSYICTFEKDVLYPKETINLTVDIDNTKCGKSISKYKIKLLKRT